jgi:hypothetical protein
MRCVICGRAIDDAAYAPTTSGEYVHIRCADRDARIAQQARTYRALINFVLIIILLLYIFHIKVYGISFVLLSTALIAGHIVIHRLWWRLILRSAYLWSWRRKWRKMDRS